MTLTKEYWTWTEKDHVWKQASSNASLFRFFGHSGFDFNGKAVLEIGFGHGADLLEAQRRGSRIYGVDINAAAVTAIRRHTGLDSFKQADASKEPFDFGVEFDAIYSRDTIYYLTEEEIAAFARHCFASLAPHGRIVVHFIQSDWVRKVIPAAADPIDSQEWTLLDGTFAGDDNPIRILDPVRIVDIFEAQNGQLIGRKTLSETYGIREEYLRCQRYFMFAKR
jgi:hypothetical protein